MITTTTTHLCILTITTLISATHACPTECLCTNDGIVQCNVKNLILQKIPANIPNTTRHLFLGGNFIKEIQSDDLVHLRSLEILGLSSNFIATIHKGAFRNQGRLTTLSLRGNALSRITRDTFEGLSNLTTLDLSQVTSQGLPLCIEDKSFEHLTRLKTLKLDRNNMIALSNYTFHGLNELFQLDISQNKFELITSGVFKSIPLASLVFDDVIPCCCSSVYAVKSKLQGIYMHCLSYNAMASLSACKNVDASCDKLVVSTCMIRDRPLNVSSSSVTILPTTSVGMVPSSSHVNGEALAEKKTTTTADIKDVQISSTAQLSGSNKFLVVKISATTTHASEIRIVVQNITSSALKSITKTISVTTSSSWLHEKRKSIINSTAILPITSTIPNISMNKATFSRVGHSMASSIASIKKSSVTLQYKLSAVKNSSYLLQPSSINSVPRISDISRITNVMDQTIFSTSHFAYNSRRSVKHGITTLSAAGLLVLAPTVSRIIKPTTSNSMVTANLSIYQSINQSINQSTNQSMNLSINQSTKGAAWKENCSTILANDVYCVVLSERAWSDTLQPSIILVITACSVLFVLVVLLCVLCLRKKNSDSDCRASYDVSGGIDNHGYRGAKKTSHVGVTNF